MQASQPNSSTIHLYWDPPFTLDITNVNPDISGYTVSITNTNTNVTSERNVTKPEFLFQEEGYDPCHVYVFEVSAWNPVGVGEKSDVIDECFGGGWLILMVWNIRPQFYPSESFCLCAAPQSANVNWTKRESSVDEDTTLQLIIIVSLTD